MRKFPFEGWTVCMGLASNCPDNVIRVQQEHGARFVAWNRLRPADAIYTKINGPPVGVLTADCMPLAVMTSDLAVVVHVSRKTAIAGQLDHMTEVLNPKHITQVFVGPHICADHFIFEELGFELRQFNRRWPKACKTLPIGTSVSLQKMIGEYFKKWHVTTESVFTVHECTYESGYLPSYRRSMDNDEVRTDSIVTWVESGDNAT